MAAISFHQTFDGGEKELVDLSLCPLTAISPIDGRYRSRVEALSRYFSELALIRYRVFVEVEYFIALCELEKFSIDMDEAKVKESFASLRSWAQSFDVKEALKVKECEKITNHDIKAVEYAVKDVVKKVHLEEVVERVHFALTSQDINNTAIPMMIRDAFVEEYLPTLQSCVLSPLREMVVKYADIPMLSRTHGQPATPTRVGSQIAVFVERIESLLLHAIPNLCFSGKFGGATGGMNAHVITYPKIDWQKFATDFLRNRLGLHRERHTTQVGHSDHQGVLFDLLRRINIVLIDLCRDFWTYISLEYFGQRIKQGETGSSTMPHKVNPIDFENAEGNLGVANAMFVHLGEKLPISRLQRDLSDSTVWRTTGTPFAHTLLAFRSLRRGLSKLWLREEVLQRDLNQNFVVVAEAIQTVLRREGVPDAYEILKKFTRTGTAITKENMADFIQNELQVDQKLKEELLAIQPSTFIGYPPDLGDALPISDLLTQTHPPLKK